MKLTKVHHVAIIGSDYEKSRHFYAEVLGLQVLREVYRAERDDWMLNLQLDDLEIELFIMPNPPARISGPEACGLRHLAFHVEDIDAAVAELERRGIACEPIRLDVYTNRRATFFRDPDGLPLELHE